MECSLEFVVEEWRLDSDVEPLVWEKLVSKFVFTLAEKIHALTPTSAPTERDWLLVEEEDVPLESERPDVEDEDEESVSV